MLKNTANQKWVVFAFDLTDNTPKTGDAAQITANLRIDGAAANAIDDTNPTELEDGYYVFDLTQAETNGDNIVICPASSTGDIQVIGCPMAVWTLDLDTKEDIRAEMDSNSTQLAAIVSAADSIPDDVVTAINTAEPNVTATGVTLSSAAITDLSEAIVAAGIGPIIASKILSLIK
jgi:hypothetical protein